MSENPNIPHSAFPASAQQGASSFSAGPYPALGQQPYQPPYREPQKPQQPQQPQGKKPINGIGATALGLGLPGFVLGAIPSIIFMSFSWMLLLAALILGIIGLFQKNQEKATSIIAIVVSVLGSMIFLIVSALTMTNMLVDMYKNW
ncbi:MAG: hypothetical protein SPI83_04860 [Rothia sp. (in: high G+C Gram-positive bacteria)]|nr:hypothetical protein [Rothia sp. (in: high G+C Gram-positive bacteria)]